MSEHVLEKEGHAFAEATAEPPYLYETRGRARGRRLPAGGGGSGDPGGHRRVTLPTQY